MVLKNQPYTPIKNHRIQLLDTVAKTYRQIKIPVIGLF